MSLVDSLDSVLMLYAYAQPELRTDGKLRIWTRRNRPVDVKPVLPALESMCGENGDPPKLADEVEQADKVAYGNIDPVPVSSEDEERAEKAQRIIEAKTSTISSLSISLTLLSILVALRYVISLPCFSDDSISLITILGLIGENCAKCTAAAEDPDGGGLAGSWWRAWARVSCWVVSADGRRMMRVGMSVQLSLAPSSLSSSRTTSPGGDGGNTIRNVRSVSWRYRPFLTHRSLNADIRIYHVSCASSTISALPVSAAGVAAALLILIPLVAVTVSLGPARTTGATVLAWRRRLLVSTLEGSRRRSSRGLERGTCTRVATLSVAGQRELLLLVTVLRLLTVLGLLTRVATRRRVARVHVTTPGVGTSGTKALLPRLLSDTPAKGLTILPPMMSWPAFKMFAPGCYQY